MMIYNQKRANSTLIMAAGLLASLTFLVTPFFNDQLRVLTAFVAFFFYFYSGHYLFRKDKLVLEMHHGMFDKDMKFYLTFGIQKLDVEKVRAYEDATSYKVQTRIEQFLERNTQILHDYPSVTLIGFSPDEEHFVKTAICQLMETT